MTLWRRAAREGRLTLPAAGEEGVAQLVVGEAHAAEHDDQGSHEVISIETDGIVIRLPGDVSVSRPGDIVRVLCLT